MNGTDPEVPGINPRSGVEALRPFMGRWVVLDASGEVHASGDTLRLAADAAGKEQIDEPEFLFVPARPFVG